MADPSAPPPPAELGGFQIVRRLGAGGMAELFVAKKSGAEGTHKVLVLKRVLPMHGASRRFRSMFVEEAQLATRLNHPNIVQVYELLDHGDDGLLLSMEYVEGTDLGKLASAARAAGARIPPWVAAHIVAEAAKGLHYAHERKEGGKPLDIVHRDVSPQNVLLSFDGAVKIADFGIASANLFREQAGELKGKFGYMSPEQARGEKVDRRSDIYALGVVLHELLTGRRIHRSLGGDALLEAVRSGIVEPPSTYVRDVPPELEAIVMRALARDPDARFPTARDMAIAITRATFARHEPVDAGTVEALVSQLIGRELTSPGFTEPASPSIAIAGQPPAAATAATSDGAPVGPRRESHAPGRSREVRHVAVVTLALQGAESLTPHARDDIRATLDHIAYKRGARWSWQPDRARAVVGLLANPSGAASDAAWLALDVHEALAGLDDEHRSPVRAAVGIVRGIAVGVRDPLGHLVSHELQEPAGQLSERLAAETPAGRTWVGGGLYRLVRRQFVWGDAPTLALPARGPEAAPTAMRVYALERPLSRDERLADMALGQSDLVGRDAEKADLVDAYHQAASSPGHVVARVVVGEMGIGKTALVSTFVSELPPDARVLRVEASSARVEVPFGVVAGLVREALAAPADRPVAELAAELESVLGRVSGEPSAALAACLADLAAGVSAAEADDADQGYLQKLVHLGVRRLLAALAAERPLVVVVDGLESCDRASIDLLVDLARRGDAHAMLLLLVLRPDARVEGALAGLVRTELRGLGNDEQLRFVELRLGVTRGVADVCAELLPRAAGNPFFLLEMVDALLERGAFEIRDGDGAEQVLVRTARAGERAALLPSTLEQLVGDRLRELPADERAVADWLAIVGGPVDARALATLAGEGSGAAVERLVARGLCDRRGDEVELRHPVAREVAYLALAPAQRAQMHRAVGELLAAAPASRGSSAALVARHFARAGLSSRAADLYLEAAAAARAGFQLALAVRHFERALLLLPEGDARRVVAHEALETAFRMLGRRRERREHLLALRAMAKASRRPAWVALALVRSARLDLDEGFLVRGVPLAQQAEAVARVAASPALEVEAQALACELLRELGDVQGALAASDRALATAASPDVPPRARAEVLRTRGVLLRRVGRVREAVEAHAEAIATFRSVGARRLEARAKSALAFAMFVLERFEDAIALAQESIAIDLAIGGRFQIAKTLTNIGQAYARLGDMPRALAYLRRARDAHARYADHDSRADTLLVSAEVLVAAGDVDAAEVLLGDAGALNAVTASGYDRAHEQIVRALVHLARGDAPGAAGHAAEARRLASEQLLVSFELYATAIEAAARVAAGEGAAGAALATTAASAIESAQGSEYGVEIRALACEALARAGSPRAPEACERAASHARAIASAVRDARLAALFRARPIVARLLSARRSPEESSA